MYACMYVTHTTTKLLCTPSFWDVFRKDVVALFLPARRYASAVTSYGPVSVLCLSVTSRCSIEMD